MILTARSSGKPVGGRPCGGSFSAQIEVRSEDRGRLWISRNPSKFLQGHNLFGSNDFRTLSTLFIKAVRRALEARICATDEASWRADRFEVLRIDVAESFRLPQAADVDAWIRAASHVVREKHQSISAYGGDTIYVGQRSRRVSLKAYNKAQELLGHPLPKSIDKRDRLTDFAKGLLRVEVRLLPQELKRRALDNAS